MPGMKSLICLVAGLAVAFFISSAAHAKGSNSSREFECQITLEYTDGGVAVKKKAPTTNVSDNQSVTFFMDDKRRTYSFTIQITHSHDQVIAQTTVKIFKGGKSAGTGQIIQQVGRSASVRINGVKIDAKTSLPKE
jgi:hypothetical protein